MSRKEEEKKKYHELEFRVNPFELYKSSVTAEAYARHTCIWAVKIKL